MIMYTENEMDILAEIAEENQAYYDSLDIDEGAEDTLAEMAEAHAELSEEEVDF